MKTKLILPAVALVLHAAVHAAPNLVANGSFEQGPGGLGSFTGWQTTLGDATTFVDSSGQTGPHPGEAVDGLWSAYFGSTAADGGSAISQLLTTVVGQTYQLSYALANDNGGLASLNSFAVSVGGRSVQTYTDLGVQDYAIHLISFVAESTSTALRFSGSNDNGYLQLDQVSVAAIPEPSTTALTWAGLGLIGAFISTRRRRDRRHGPAAVTLR